MIVVEVLVEANNILVHQAFMYIYFIRKFLLATLFYKIFF